MNAQLKKLAKEMFEAYPEATVFVVTTDNQFFFPENSNAAQAHQDYLNRPKEANDKLVRVTREEAMAPDAPPAEEVPTEKSTAKQIAAYLTSKGVEFDATLKKDALVAKLNEYVASLTPPPPPAPAPDPE